MQGIERIKRACGEEFGGLSLRRSLGQCLAGLLPVDTCPRLRAHLYRLAGVRVGAGTIITGRLHLTGGRHAARKLRIGACCYLNDEIYFNLGETISIGEGVSMGMKCLLITATHEIGEASFRAGAVGFRPISIGPGSWLAAAVTVLPGVEIGAGTVVGAGAVVNCDLPPNVFAAGVPARVIRSLDEES